MKVTNRLIYDSLKTLRKIKSTDFPIKITWKLNKVINVITEKWNLIEQHRNELIKKYGQEKDGGYFIDAKDAENISKFVKDFEELLSIEEEIDIEPLTIEELDGSTLNGNELDTIIWLIK